MEKVRITKLEKFLKMNGIRPVDVSRKSGYSRQHLLRLRKGMQEPTRRCIAAITAACRELGTPGVGATDLFDLDARRSKADRHSQKE